MEKKKNFRKNFKNKRNSDSRSESVSKSKEERKVDAEANKVPECNDWKFYAASDEIAKDVASLPFNYLGGTPFKVSTTTETDANPSISENALPSVLNIQYTDSIGITDKRTEGANMAAVQLYTYIRHANSGAKNYEAADVMMYILAMRSIYSSFFQAKKVLGIATLYNYYNHNLPDLLLHAYNLDTEDLRSNLAQYRGRLNILAKKINSFAVPKYFKIFDRTAYINSFIFTDSTSIRGQFYNFINCGHYTWSGTTSTSGTELVFTYDKWGHNIDFISSELDTVGKVKYSEMLDVIDNQLNALFLDEDAITMSGDILKAFNESELYTIVQTAEDYSTPITFDEDILAQIENSHCIMPHGVQTGRLEEILGSVDTEIFDFNVTQSNQIIQFKPTVKIPNHSGTNKILICKNLVLNSHKDKPDYTDVLEWTRLMSINNVTANAGIATVSVESTGLELVLGYTVMTYAYDEAFGGTYVSRKIIGYMVTNNARQSGTSAYNDAGLTLMPFDWHPFVYAGLPSTAFGDFKVATLVDVDTVNKINDAAVYGALYGSQYNRR